MAPEGEQQFEAIKPSQALVLGKCTKMVEFLNCVNVEGVVVFLINEVVFFWIIHLDDILELDVGNTLRVVSSGVLKLALDEVKHKVTLLKLIIVQNRFFASQFLHIALNHHGSKLNSCKSRTLHRESRKVLRWYWISESKFLPVESRDFSPV